MRAKRSELGAGQQIEASAESVGHKSVQGGPSISRRLPWSMHSAAIFEIAGRSVAAEGVELGLYVLFGG